VWKNPDEYWDPEDGGYKRYVVPAYAALVYPGYSELPNGGTSGDVGLIFLNQCVTDGANVTAVPIATKEGARPAGRVGPAAAPAPCSSPRFLPRGSRRVPGRRRGAPPLPDSGFRDNL
jgi:hypothetical protein